ncbi:hypothetical protein TWF751_004152 [Orbilia oligospora]|nr:hypothetical protein TWF751_004152 [Orbilia oligospora]
MAAKQAIALVAGVGPGTGAAIAKKFASLYNVVLLARTPSSYETTVQEINKSGGTAIGFPADVRDEASIKNVFEQVTKQFPDKPVAAAVYNVGGVFIRKPFWNSRLKGLSLDMRLVSWVHLSLPKLLSRTSFPPPNPLFPTLRPSFSQALQPP